MEGTQSTTWSTGQAVNILKPLKMGAPADHRTIWLLCPFGRAGLKTWEAKWTERPPRMQHAYTRGRSTRSAIAIQLTNWERARFLRLSALLELGDVMKAFDWLSRDGTKEENQTDV